MRVFKAVELERSSRRRTGRELLLEAESRQAAIDALLQTLNVPPETAHADPTRTLVQLGEALWTIVPQADPTEPGASPAQRRSGAKHKHVR
jgi:hypothetical protein